jgi:type II secretory pathway pseudopilin PulG
MDPMIPSSPGLAALVVVLLAIAGGMVGYRWLRLVKETARALRVRITRARQRVALAQLRVARSELADVLEGLEDGLDLPGSVTAEGMVIASEQVPPGGKM